MKHPRNPARRGSAYVFVLGATTLIITAGILATTLQRQRLVKQRDVTTSAVVDRGHASALEYAVALVENDPSGNAWRPFRQLVINAPAMPGETGATHRIMLTDPADTDMRTVNLADPVRLSVDSAIGAAKRRTEMDFAFDVTPLAALDNALIREQKQGAGTVLTIGTTATSSVRPTRDAAFNANAQIGVSPTQFLDAVETMNGAVTMTVPMPPAELFAYYQSIGTVITLTGTTNYDKVLFSPTSNPGNTGLNARGVYVIIANNNRVNIRNSRVLGTLVIINPSTLSEIGPKVSMSPASSDLPTLLVQGSLEFMLGDADVTEPDAARNLNPAGAPYLGSTDSDTSDAYPSRIRGLTYVSTNAGIDENSAFEGVLWVGGKLIVASGKTVKVRWAPLTQAIPGFSQATTMRVNGQSVRRLPPP